MSLSVDSFMAFTARPLDCPCDQSTDQDLFQFLESVSGESPAANPTTDEQETEECPLQLRPGESAQEIQEIARRMGPGPLHGTIFDDESTTVAVPIPGMDGCFRARRNCDSLARAIRALEERDRQQRYESPNIEAAFEDSGEPTPLRAGESLEGIPFGTNHGAMRNAARHGRSGRRPAAGRPDAGKGSQPAGGTGPVRAGR